jgi:hypothetical protein
MKEAKKEKRMIESFESLPEEPDAKDPNCTVINF